ncbi:MAG: aminopeptidase, partial [Muribaculaceae bacterium]|nr:aminopeptidase [Muribaculaceae bacterium]
MIRKIALCVALTSALAAFTQGQGGISAEMLNKFKASYTDDAANKARHNALNAASIDKLAFNEAVRNKFDDNFSHKVETKGITDQK